MQSSRFRAETVIGGKWVLDRPLGRGGMGEVWVAKHASLDEEVALKLLDRRTLGSDILDEARSRFHLEAQIAARLAKKSRHIAGVVDHGHEGDFDYLVLELLRGSPLDEYLAKVGRVPPSEVAAIVRQIARALTVAHREGVVHRDLKPGNVFITHDDEGRMLVKLLDFGIAKAAAQPQRPATASADGVEEAPKSSHRTRLGIVLGTPEYMSPEQARGVAVDGRADVWALASITFELLTGIIPFPGESETDVMINVCLGKYVLARDLAPELPEPIDALFAHAFDLELGRRFADPASFSAALDHALNERASKTEISVGGGVPLSGVASGRISLPMSAPRAPASGSVHGVVIERVPVEIVPVASAKPAPEPASAEIAPPPRKSRAPAALAAGALLVALLAAFFVLRANPSPPPGRAGSEPSSVSASPKSAPTPVAASATATEAPIPTVTPSTTASTPPTPPTPPTSAPKPKAAPHAPAGKTTTPTPSEAPAAKKVDPSEIL